MAVIPSIKVNGNLPRPDGTEPNSTFVKGTGSATITLASTVGIGSILYEIVSKPIGSAVALSIASPATPFTTQLLTLDLEGTYILRATANGDAASIKEVAITVLATESSDSLRIPAQGETSQWTSGTWWLAWARDLVLDLMKRRIGVAAVALPDADSAISAANVAKRTLLCSGTFTGPHYASIDATGINDPVWFVRNDCGNALTIKKPGGGGTGVAMADTKGAVIAWNGSDFVAVALGA